MQNTPQSSHYRIGIYLEIPGLRMCPVAAIVMAGVVTEPLRRALAAKNLLSPQPLSPADKKDLSNAARQAAAIFQHGPPGDKEAESIVVTACNFLRRNGGDSGVQVFAYFNWFFILVDVSDIAPGLLAVQRELERVNLLAYSEIAHIDPEEDLCRTFYPPGFDKPFERHWPLVKKLWGYGVNLLKGETA